MILHFEVDKSVYTTSVSSIFISLFFMNLYFLICQVPDTGIDVAQLVVQGFRMNMCYLV